MSVTDYQIKGLIKHQDTLKGIPDLLVVAFDLDAPSLNQKCSVSGYSHLNNYDRLGSVLTDAEGLFILNFTEQDFRATGQELRPDILLVVQAPEISKENPFENSFINSFSLGERIIHISPPIRVKAGKVESYSIRITSVVYEKFMLGPVQKQILPDPRVLESSLKVRADNSRALIQVRLNNINSLIQSNSALHAAANQFVGNFTLSTVSKEIKAKDTYLNTGDNLSDLQSSVFNRKVSELTSGAQDIQLALKLTPAMIGKLSLLTPEGNLKNEISSTDFWKWWIKNNDTILERNIKPFEQCIRLFREEDLAPSSPTPEVPADPNLLNPAENQPEFTLNDQVKKLIACSTCPEEPLQYAKLIDTDYKSRDLRNTINGLELVSGPTDVTSYHDFHSIQIAFETIWTEVFDERLGELGKEIFTEVVRSYNENCSNIYINPDKLNISNADSLKSLLYEYRNITGGKVNKRLELLFTELEERLAQPYKFDVFAANSINYGVIFTYRQKWEPGPYQVGKLVNTIPLGPKEERKYTTKVTRKLTKAQKEIENREFKGSSESSDTSRAESEIINRASNKTSFSTNAQGQLNFEIYQMQFGMNTGMESEKFSSSTKKNFREAVTKAAQEYRKQTQLEVSTSSEQTFEETRSGSLLNSNDEIPVTYLFYELQRQYHISEQLHRVTPVIAVAFEVPKAHEIDTDWIMTYAWILRRALLDESFLPTLDYVTQGSVGSELAMQELGQALKKQQKLVDELNRELELRNKHVEDLVGKITDIMTADNVVQTVKDVGDFVNGLVNPLGSLFGGIGGGSSGPDLSKFKEVLELQLERSEKEQQRLASRIKEAQSDLLTITQKFGEVTRQHFDQQTSKVQCEIHFKENILYYMQAIWDYEPPDQRYFRLYDLEVDWFESPETAIPLAGLAARRNPSTGAVEYEGAIKLPIRGVRRTKRKLVDVADIDNLLGFKGNYAIFPVKDPNYIHLHMMQDYIDTQTGGLKDPDAFADITTQDLIDYLKCVRREAPEIYKEQRDTVINMINERQKSPRREKDLIIVPTDSLYLECLPGKHPVLEDFKLVHRAVDVKKVQAEVRKMELESVRYAARLLNGETQDPEIEKQININGNLGTLNPEA